MYISKTKYFKQVLNLGEFLDIYVFRRIFIYMQVKKFIFFKILCYLAVSNIKKKYEYIKGYKNELNDIKIDTLIKKII